IPTSYHLSVVVDDALQGVTQVVRGQDLFWSTSVHRLLQALLTVPVPAYHHHRLVLDSEGRKLSKSTRATALRTLRQDGVTPAARRKLVGLRHRSSRRGFEGPGEALGPRAGPMAICPPAGPCRSRANPHDGSKRSASRRGGAAACHARPRSRRHWRPLLMISVRH